jgi:ATP-dependent Lon protease
MLGFRLTSPKQYAVLPLRDIVVFPHMIVPLFVGREKSVAALEKAMEGSKQVLLLTQKSPAIDDPVADDLFQFGTVGTILQLLKLPDGTVKVLVEGEKRAQVSRFVPNESYLEVEASEVEDKAAKGEELDALAKAVLTQFEEYVKLNKKIPPEVIVSVNQIDDPSKLADTIASHLTLKIEEKQKLLEIDSTAQSLEHLFGLMEGEIGVLQVEKRIRGRVKRQMEKTQREYYLNEQMKAIQN